MEKHLRAKDKAIQQIEEEWHDNTRDTNKISSNGDAILAPRRKASNNKDTPTANKKANDQQALWNDTETATKTRHQTEKQQQTISIVDGQQQAIEDNVPNIKEHTESSRQNAAINTMEPRWNDNNNKLNTENMKEDHQHMQQPPTWTR